MPTAPHRELQNTNPNHMIMKRLFVWIPVMLLILAIQDTQAQSIRSMIRNKIIEDSLEDQAKRDSARAVEEGREPEKNPNTTLNQVYLDALGLSGDVAYESSYDFDAFLRMEITEMDRNGREEEKQFYDSYLTRNTLDYAMVFSGDDGRSTIIFDTENSSMLILTESDGERSGMAMGIDPEEMEEEIEEIAEESGVDPYAGYKTGKTKNICGYSCDEYFVEDEYSEARMWVSEKLGSQIRGKFLDNQQTFGAAFYHAAYFNGMVMEYDHLDKDDGSRSVMVVTEVDLNRSSSISTRGYSIMSIKIPPPEEEEEE